MEKDIKLIRKLPRYYRYLKEQMEVGVKIISSNDLADLMRVSPSQVRQDFNRLGYNGFHAVGYNIELLLNKIVEFMELDKKKKAIIIGAGNLGQSLCRYHEISESGLELMALFDINPKIVGLVIDGKYKVHDMDELEDYIKANDIKTAFICTTAESTLKALQMSYSYGVKSFLLFSPVLFGVPEDAIIENVHIDDNIKLISYKLSLLDK